MQNRAGRKKNEAILGRRLGITRRIAAHGSPVNERGEASVFAGRALIHGARL